MALLLMLLSIQTICGQSLHDVSSSVQLTAWPSKGEYVHGADIFASKMLQLREQISSRGEDPYAKDPAHLAAVVLYAVELTGHLFAFCPWLDFLMWAAVGIPAYVQQYVTENDGTKTIDGFAEAVSILTQQMTTIGYGSTTAHENSTVSMAVHSLGSLIAQLGLGSWWKDIVNLIFDASKCRRPMLCSFIEFTLAFATNVLMFAYDCPWGGKSCQPFPSALEWMKGVYTTVISMTTVGYGDVSPQHNYHKMASFFTQPWLGSSFEEVVSTYPVWLLKEDKKEYLKRPSLFGFWSSAVDPVEGSNDDTDEEDYARSFGDDGRYLAENILPAKVARMVASREPDSGVSESSAALAPMDAPDAPDLAASTPSKLTKGANWVVSATKNVSNTITNTIDNVGEYFKKQKFVAQVDQNNEKVTVHNPWLSFDFKKLRVCKHVWKKKTPSDSEQVKERVG